MTLILEFSNVVQEQYVYSSERDACFGSGQSFEGSISAFSIIHASVVYTFIVRTFTLHIFIIDTDDIRHPQLQSSGSSII